MTRFYKELMAGHRRDEALRSAKRQVRELYPDPFYWSPFICQGDQTPLLLNSQVAS
jgi:CHAT domain-containing protein